MNYDIAITAQQQQQDPNNSNGTPQLQLQLQLEIQKQNLLGITIFLTCMRKLFYLSLKI